MTFSFGKKQLLTLLFFLYYLSYAISPLTYTFPEQKILDRVSSAAAPTAKGVSLFLWELAMEKVVPSEKTKPDHTVDTVIIKKKRVLLPENATTKLLPFDTASLPKKHFTPPVIGRWTTRLVAFHGTREGFSTVHAGHSPPLG